MFLDVVSILTLFFNFTVESRVSSNADVTDARGST